MSITKEQAATWFSTMRPPGPAAREMYRMAAKALRPVSLEKADDDDPVSQRLVNMAKNVVRSRTLERIEEAWRGGWIAVRESEITGFNPEFAGHYSLGGYKCSQCEAEAVLDCNDESVLDNFCPRCGAAMTDEAVEMVMERLEVLYAADIERPCVDCGVSHYASMGV